LLFTSPTYHLIPNILIPGENKKFPEEALSANVFLTSLILKLPYPISPLSKSI